MCRDLTHEVEAVKPDRAETDRFRIPFSRANPPCLGRLGVSGLSRWGGGIGMRTPYSFAPANDRKTDVDRDTGALDQCARVRRPRKSRPTWFARPVCSPLDREMTPRPVQYGGGVEFDRAFSSTQTVISASRESRLRRSTLHGETRRRRALSHASGVRSVAGGSSYPDGSADTVGRVQRFKDAIA